MWKLIDNEAMLSDLEQGQTIALQQEGRYTKFIISTVSENSCDYITLNHPGEEVFIKCLPMNKLTDGKWYVEAL